VKPDGRLKLVGGVRDLQVIDADGLRCGIADDIEFRGKPGAPLAIKAILVGPGAWRGRLPRWAMWIVASIAGDGIVRVPWEKVATVSSEIKLSCAGRELGLMKYEDQAGRFIPHRGAL
jgi:hypothetical protein